MMTRDQTIALLKSRLRGLNKIAEHMDPIFVNLGPQPAQCLQDLILGAAAIQRLMYATAAELHALKNPDPKVIIFEPRKPNAPTKPSAA